MITEYERMIVSFYKSRI